MKNLIKSIALGALMSVIISTNVMANDGEIKCKYGTYGIYKQTYNADTTNITQEKANEFCKKNTGYYNSSAVEWRCPNSYNWGKPNCQPNTAPTTCATLGETCWRYSDDALTRQAKGPMGNNAIDSASCQSACDALQANQ